MIPVIKRHEVQVLLDAGFTHRQVAQKAGVSKRTVTRTAQEPRIEGLDDVGIARARQVGRPSQVGEFREAVEGILEKEPELPTVEILHRLKVRGYEGGKSAVYKLVKALRGPAPSRVMVRFEGLPAEASSCRGPWLTGWMRFSRSTGPRATHVAWGERPLPAVPSSPYVRLDFLSPACARHLSGCPTQRLLTAVKKPRVRSGAERS